MMNAIIIFALATIVNVSLSTIRSICTIKCGKWVSAATNAVCYGFYPLIVMLTAKGTVDIIVNMGITAVANFVCVWVIKYIEEKSRKDKLWKVEATFHHEYLDEIKANVGLPFNYIEIGDKVIVNFYCETQHQSLIAKDIVNKYNGKYFVSESKTL
jgi:uncharacterized protein YebE (UPF0316 family)